MTTRDPGASEVFTHGLGRRPRSTAFLASSPAASITSGFDVLVQRVMAAITTCPWSISAVVLAEGDLDRLRGRGQAGAPAERRGIVAARCR